MNTAVPKKLAKVFLNGVQNVVVRLLQTSRLIDFPVPPNSVMRRTSSTSIRHYYDSGIRTYLPIATCALREGIHLDQSINILDFGCGGGRQLLHFTRNHPSPRYFACDIDDTAIAFVARSYPKVEAHANAFSPPLQYHDAYFDMIYSVSIFSHLSMVDQWSWLKELARITRPGGYCFLTTKGYPSLDYLHPSLRLQHDDLANALMREGFAYREYQWLDQALRTQDFLRIASPVVRSVTGSYGSTFLAPEYIRKNWDSDAFQVVDVIEGIIDSMQDLIVLRRKGFTDYKN